MVLVELNRLLPDALVEHVLGMPGTDDVESADVDAERLHDVAALVLLPAPAEPVLAAGSGEVQGAKVELQGPRFRLSRDLMYYIYIYIYIYICLHRLYLYISLSLYIYIYDGCNISCDQVFIWIVLAASLAGTLRDPCGTQDK